MIAQKIAQHLLDIEAVTLSPDEPFTWASGMKSPIYCDNRVTISYPHVRKDITEAFVELIQKHYPDVEAIVGTATAGIPQACWVADAMNLPMAYVRAEAKGHGRTQSIEGSLRPGTKVVVIEDLISTGGSSVRACNVLEDSAIEVLGVAAIFTYELAKATQTFEDAKIDLQCISNYSTLIECATDLTQAQKDLLKSWKENPDSYGK